MRLTQCLRKQPFMYSKGVRVRERHVRRLNNRRARYGFINVPPLGTQESLLTTKAGKYHRYGSFLTICDYVFVVKVCNVTVCNFKVSGLKPVLNHLVAQTASIRDKVWLA